MDNTTKLTDNVIALAIHIGTQDNLVTVIYHSNSEIIT